MKNLLIALLLINLLATSAYAVSDRSQARLMFQEANAHYLEKEYKKAIEGYEDVRSAGFESGHLYYNLGNAYFKEGFLGEAILNYLRARRFTPRDPDLKANLEYARSLIKDGQIKKERNPIAGLFFKLSGFFTLNENILTCSVVYFILSLVLILAILIERIRGRLLFASVLSLSVLLIFISFTVVNLNRIVLQKRGVIISEVTPAKFEPLDYSTTYFTLHEGNAVMVTNSKKDWLKVKRRDGKQGWVRRNAIKLI